MSSFGTVNPATSGCPFRRVRTVLCLAWQYQASWGSSRHHNEYFEEDEWTEQHTFGGL